MTGDVSRRQARLITSRRGFKSRSRNVKKIARTNAGRWKYVPGSKFKRRKLRSGPFSGWSKPPRPRRTQRERAIDDQED